MDLREKIILRTLVYWKADFLSLFEEVGEGHIRIKIYYSRSFKAGELPIIIVWIILIAFFIVSIWSVIDGIKNRSRYIISERIKYYLVSLFISLFIIFLISLSSDDMDLGLLITVVISLILIFGNSMYYTRVEKIKNALEIKFRLLKYIFVSIVILLINLILSEVFQ